MGGRGERPSGSVPLELRQVAKGLKNACVNIDVLVVGTESAVQRIAARKQPSAITHNPLARESKGQLGRIFFRPMAPTTVGRSVVAVQHTIKE